MAPGQIGLVDSSWIGVNAGMEWFTDIFWHEHRLFGISWDFWKVLGWAGNLTFFSRFIVQWYLTEKKKRVVVPVSFWWLSLVGSLLLLIYSFSQKDSVFIFAYALAWIPYIRNLMIHKQTEKDRIECPGCAVLCISTAHYCAACGHKLPTEEADSPSPIISQSPLG